MKRPLAAILGNIKTKVDSSLFKMMQMTVQLALS